MNLEDAVILVTGGAHRVGKAIALALAGEKANIAFTYNSSESAAVQTEREIESLGVQVLTQRCDQSDPEQINATVQAVISRFMRLDGLVNSASVMPEVGFMDITPQEWDTILNINARGPFLFTQAVSKWMVGHEGGCVVNIIDESVVAPVPTIVHHGASKAALWNLTQSSALALAPKVRVNAVLPGAVMKPQGWDEAIWEALAESIPLKKMGTPEDVAHAVVYLMKEDFITGQVIVVDGGKTLVE